MSFFRAGLLKTVFGIFCLAAVLAPPRISHALAPQSSFQERKQSLRELMDPKGKAIVINDLDADWPAGPLPLKGMLYINDKALLGYYPEKYAHRDVLFSWRFVNGLRGSHAKLDRMDKYELGHVIHETLKIGMWHGNRKSPEKGILIVWDGTGDSLRLDMYDEGTQVLVPGLYADVPKEAGHLGGRGHGLELAQKFVESWETQAVWDKFGNHVGTRVLMAIPPAGFSWRPFLGIPEHLKEYLNSPGWLSQQVAAKISHLREFDADATEELRDFGRSAGKNVRTEAKMDQLDVLSETLIQQESEMVEKLKKIIEANKKDEYLQTAVARAKMLQEILSLQRPELLPFLVQLYRTEDSPDVRASLAQVFGKFQSYQVQDILLELFKEETQKQPKLELIKALGRVGEPRMAQYILPYLDQEDADLAKDAMIAFANLCNADLAHVAPDKLLEPGLAVSTRTSGRKQTLREIVDPAGKAHVVEDPRRYFKLPLPIMFYIPDAVLLTASNDRTVERISAFVNCFLGELEPAGIKRYDVTTTSIDFMLRETLKNSLAHGNNKRPEKGIFFSWRVRENRLLVDIYDEGETVFIPWTTDKRERPGADTLTGRMKGLEYIQQELESWRVQSVWDRAGHHVGHKISIGIPLYGFAWKAFLDRPERLKSYLESSAWLSMDVDAKIKKLGKLEEAVREELRGLDHSGAPEVEIVLRKETLEGAIVLLDVERSVVKELQALFMTGNGHFKDNRSRGKLLLAILRLRRPESLPFLLRLYKEQSDPAIRAYIARTFQRFRAEYVQDILMELIQQESQQQPKLELLAALNLVGHPRMRALAFSQQMDGVGALAASL